MNKKSDFKGMHVLGRRLLCLLMMAVLLCGFTPSRAKVEEIQPVRVAVINYPNYLQRQPDGGIYGYAYEYLQKIATYTGWEYEFVDMTFADASLALSSGEIDLLAGNQYTAGRAELFDYSARDMGEGGSVLCILPGDMRYCYNDYASYDGIRIAGLDGSIRIDQTREMLAQYGVSADFYLYETDEQSKTALENGEVDAVLMSTIRCESDYTILARINSAPLYFCINRQRPEIKAALDDAMEKIHLEIPYYEEQLDEKYYGDVPVQLAFTQAEKEYIAAAGPIAVAASNDLIPLEYYSAAEEEYCGIVPDSLRLIEQYSGLRFELLPRANLDTLHEQMRAGEVQLVASIANLPAIAEQWGVSLTDPYFDNNVSQVMKSSRGQESSGQSKAVLCAGYPFLEQIALAQGYREILYADSFQACLSLVESGEADSTLIPSNCVESLLSDGYYENLSSYMVPNSYMNFCIGVSAQENPLLLSILNKSIASITKEQRAELLVRNLTSVSRDVTLHDFLEANRVWITLAALTAAAILVAAALLLSLARQRTNRRLRAALEKADAASRAKTDFLARMSHDMRTPMNGILGLSYLMEDQTEQEMKRELPQLREAGEYLLQLINDVLDVNKVESGGIKLHPKPCDEQQLFDSIIQMLRPMIEQKSIDFHFDKINIEWTWMLLDEQRVKQIFINLLSNAIKFTPQGGRIDFVMELVQQNEQVIRDKFIVRDTGIGMTKEFLPRVFEPFAQENRLPGSAVGSGLGLSIAKSLVELMGGTISVQSELNCGTEFTLFLDFPLAKQETANRQAGKTVCLRAGTRILLCEDQPLNAQIAVRLLEKQGAVVDWEKDGRLGTEAFASSSPGLYDAVLMDIRMPVMNGLEVAQIIRGMNRPDAKTVPIIAMTANAYEEDVQKSLEAGMNAHLAKPIDPQELVQLLAKVTARP